MKKFSEYITEAKRTMGQVAGEVLEMVERDMEEVDSIWAKKLRKIASTLSKLTTDTSPAPRSIQNEIGSLMNSVMDIDWFEEPDDYEAVYTLYKKMVNVLK